MVSRPCGRKIGLSAAVLRKASELAEPLIGVGTGVVVRKPHLSFRLRQRGPCKRQRHIF